jgi:putative phosphoesterase
MTRVGLISDTHNLLRPQALEFLRGSDLILHAGDICSAEVLERLRELAPVVAVRGNNDTGDWAHALPLVERVQVERVSVLMLHDAKQLRLEKAAEPQVVVAGHSHRPMLQQRGDTLFVNPGSAGPRRFKLPVGVGELRIDGSAVTPRLVTLTV